MKEKGWRRTSCSCAISWSPYRKWNILPVGTLTVWTSPLPRQLCNITYSHQGNYDNRLHGNHTITVTTTTVTEMFLHQHSLPPAYEVRREVMFSVCSHPGGGGKPHLHPIILPLVPCPFSSGSRTWSRGSKNFFPRFCRHSEAKSGEQSEQYNISI